MIAALFIEQSDGTLIELQAGGYERVFILDGHAKFPAATEDWPNVTHVVAGDTDDDIPKVIRPHIHLLPCGGAVALKGDTITVDTGEQYLPTTLVDKINHDKQKASPQQSGFDLGIYD